MTPDLTEIYHSLAGRYGPQHWWPGDSPFEIMIGAVLVQNTTWKNVEKAIAALKEESLLDPQSLLRLSQEDLAELIRPAGYYQVKAKRLRNLLHYLMERYDGDLQAMFAQGTSTLREELLAINGIGPETVDSILLYAGNKPTFVVDAYTYRILYRHGWIPRETDYHQMQEFFQEKLPDDPALYNEYHALLVRVGKEHCRPTPKCENCPLATYLPEGGPIAEDW